MPVTPVKKKTAVSKKKSSVKGRGASARRDSSAKPRRSPVSGLRSPVSSSPATPAEQLSTQVAALQEQLAELRAAVEPLTPCSSGLRPPNDEDGLRPPSDAHRAPLQPPPATAANPHPPSAIRHQSSAIGREAALPIYELKETRPVGYQSRDILDSSTEESRGGFFTGLLDRARIQWLMGDWEGLGKIRLEEIMSHPDKAKLALLGAAGCLQTGKFIEGKIFMRMALDWGAHRGMAAMFLCSGAHYSLGNAAAAAKDTQRQALHFERAKAAIQFSGNSESQKTISNRA